MELTSFTAMLFEGLFYVALLMSTIYGVVFGYHWNTYGSSKRMSTVALAVYIIGTLVLLMSMFTLTKLMN